MNIRTINQPDATDAALRASLQTHGWRDTEPAIIDEHGTVLRGNRRMAIAKELGIEPVTVTIAFGAGPEADKQRLIAATVSNIGRKEMAISDRRRLAVLFYESGMTMAQISAMFGVAEMTISRDLANSNTVLELKPHAKTATNPRGAGRPRKPATKTEQARPAIRDLLERGEEVDRQALKEKLGLTDQPLKTAEALERGRQEGLAEAAEQGMDKSILSKSAQEKLAAFERRVRAELEADFERRVREEVARRLAERDAQDTEVVEQANELIRHESGRQRPPFTAHEYNHVLLWAFHPDNTNPSKLTDAFILLRRKKLILCDEGPIKRKSDMAPPLPKSVDELVRVRRTRPKVAAVG